MLQLDAENGGRLPFKAYCKKVQTFHTPFVDLAVVYAPKIGVPEVLLELRPKKAHLYPGQWNIAGGNFQFRETLAEASTRLTIDCGYYSGRPIFAGVTTYVKTLAEVGISFFYIYVIAEKPQSLKDGLKFFSLHGLPGNFVLWQKSVYPQMILDFLDGKPPGIKEYLGED